MTAQTTPPKTAPKIVQAVQAVQVAKTVRTVAPCPACAHGGSPGLVDTEQNQLGPGTNGRHKRGKWRGYERSSMALCKFCKGGGVVFLEEICECGMPAVLWHKELGFYFCGAQDCMQAKQGRLAALAAASVSTPGMRRGDGQDERDDYYSMMGA